MRDICLALAESGAGLRVNTCSPRMPHRQVWVEWRDRLPATPGGTPMRAGLLVEADDAGRAGEIRCFWEQAASPLVAPVTIRFDFDRTLSRDELANTPHLGEPGLPDALRECLSHCAFDVGRDWRAAIGLTGDRERDRAEILNLARRAVPDAMLLFSFATLLGTGRALDAATVARERLNAQRLAKGRAPLLDHLDVRMSLSGGGTAHGAEGRRSRGAVRLHQVRGHLVTRSGRTFWRMNHLRGDASAGVVAARTVRVEA